MTLTSWVRTDVIPSSGLKSILSKDENFEYHLTTGGEAYYWWRTATGGTHSITTSGAGISVGNWHHVAVTFSASKLRLYIDGAMIGEKTQPGTLSSGGNSAAFIGSDRGKSEFFRGGIDDLRIYNSGLSKGEIKRLYF